MHKYYLTNDEARELANTISRELHPVSKDTKFDKWISEYMKTFNEIMNAIFNFQSSH